MLLKQWYLGRYFKVNKLLCSLGYFAVFMFLRAPLCYLGYCTRIWSELSFSDPDDFKVLSLQQPSPIGCCCYLSGVWVGLPLPVFSILVFKPLFVAFIDRIETLYTIKCHNITTICSLYRWELTCIKIIIVIKVVMFN
jgi:hypothetical protein